MTDYQNQVVQKLGITHPKLIERFAQVIEEGERRGKSVADTVAPLQDVLNRYGGETKMVVRFRLA